jgi:hypothetical protein
MTEKSYYIVSLKWTRGDMITFWRPDNSGYTWALNSAGIYTQAEIDAHPSYYNDGVGTLAVPTEIIDAMAEPVVTVSHLHELRKEKAA